MLALRNMRNLVPILLLIISHESSALSDPQIIDYYPSCGYDITHTETLRSTITTQYQQPSQAEISEEIASMQQRIKKLAIEKGAQFLVIKDRSTSTAESRRSRLTLVLEFLNTCQNPDKEGGSAASFDSAGRKIAILGTGKFEFSFEMSVDFNSGVLRPQLSNNSSVSNKEGLYGIPLDSTLDVVLNVFGTPTFKYVAQDNTILLAFGRRHWLTFNNNRLVSARFGRDRFSNELVNYFEFDERFDDRVWRLETAVSRDETLNGEQLKTVQRRQEANNNVLEVYTDVFLSNNTDYRTEKVVGFELSKRNLAQTNLATPKALSNSTLDFLTSVISNIDEFHSIDINDLPTPSLGQTNKQNGKQYLLMDASTLIETGSNTVDKIHISPTYITDIEAEQRQWRFSQFYYGQTLESALEAAGPDAFYMHDVIEINHARYTIKIFINEDNNHEHVYAMEISIY